MSTVIIILLAAMVVATYLILVQLGHLTEALDALYRQVLNISVSAERCDQACDEIKSDVQLILADEFFPFHKETPLLAPSLSASWRASQMSGQTAATPRDLERRACEGCRNAVALCARPSPYLS